MNQKSWSLSARYFVLGLLILLIIVGLWYIRAVLEPLLIAAFVAYLIHPAVNYLTRHTKLSRRGAVNLVYLFSLILLVGVPATMTSLFFDELQRITSDVQNLFNQMITWLSTPHELIGLTFNFGQLANQMTQIRSTFLTSLSENVIQLLEQTSLGALMILVVLVAVYYFLANWPEMRRRFISSFQEEYQGELEELYQRIRTIWLNYLRGQLLLMLIVGVVFTVAWTIIGIPGALVLGFIAGFLTLVPDVGPFLAAALAAGVALLEGSSWINLPHFGVALIVIAVYLILISIKNFWLRPFVMGRSVHIPEALVFIFIVMATVMWGILGALLVIPVAASLGIVFDYLRRRALGMMPFPQTKPDGTEAGPRSRAPRRRKTK